MASRITSRRLVPLLAFMVFLIAGTAPVRADKPDEAATFINDFGHRAISELTTSNLTDDELFKRFRNLFEEGFDVPFIAKSALGRFWARASDQEKADYVPAFEAYVSQIYAMKFREYSGESFQANSSQPGPEDMVTVTSSVAKPDSAPTNVQWVVGNVDGKLKIRDIKIEGVSMVSTYRDQFANEILQHDGKVAGLIEALRQKAAHLTDGSAGNG